MNRMPGLPESVASDWRSLLISLDSFAWQEIPCRAGDIVPLTWWTSDIEDEQAHAAAACAPCPALRECRAHGLKHIREEGVYGGLTPNARRQTVDGL